MKILSLVLSVAVFFTSGYFFIADFRASTDMNYLIYMSLLAILMMICVVGVMINLPLLLRSRRKVRSIIYNSYSKNRLPNKAFDSSFDLL